MERYQILGHDISSIAESAERLTGGETGASLYRVDGRVLKLAENNHGLPEIENNIKGYQGIRQEGAGELLPRDIIWHIGEDHSYIVMPDLGSDMGSRDGSGENLSDEYAMFSERIVDIISKTAKTIPGSQTKGLTILQRQIESWLRLIDEKSPGLIHHEQIDQLHRFDIAKASTDISTLMIQDFTPDNIFVDTDSLTFIDPWEQATYRGSFLPSLAQYRANAVEVRQFPSAVAADRNILNAMSEVGSILQLNDAQKKIQRNLGEALQYTLSSYVRLESETDRAIRYAHVAEAKIAEIINIGLGLDG